MDVQLDVHLASLPIGNPLFLYVMFFREFYLYVNRFKDESCVTESVLEISLYRVPSPFDMNFATFWHCIQLYSETALHTPLF